MERSDGCAATPSRGTPPAASAGLLTAAWRELAECGDPACVLERWDGVLTVAWANPALCSLARCDEHRLVGQALRDADLAQPAWILAVHRLARGSGGSATVQVESADGAAGQAVVRVAPLEASHGPASSWLVTLAAPRDASGRAVPEGTAAALAVAEERFAALAGCAPVGIFASEAGIRLGYVNPQFIALTGLPPHDLLGVGWLDAIHGDDVAAIYSAVQTVLSGAPVELTVRLSRDGERPCWVHLRLAPTTTPARAAGFVGVAEDVTERRSWEEHLVYQARHDPLTGLANRRRLVEVLGELLSGRRVRDREFAVLFVDLDGFKEVNDQYGHATGDRVLVEVAARMRRVARDADVLARASGDEFVVVLHNVVKSSEATAAARRHLEVLSRPIRLAGCEVVLSASIGVALPAEFDTPESLLRSADSLMYEAKASGHGLFRVAARPGEEE